MPWRLALLTLVVTTACGDHAGVVDSNAAQQSTVQLVALFDTMAASDGPGALVSFAKSTDAVAHIVTDGERTYTTYSVPDDYSQSVRPPHVTCDETTCTLDFLYAVYPWASRVSGTVIREGDSVSLELEGDVSHDPTNPTGTWGVSGTITATTERLDGTLHFTAQKEGSTGETTLRFDGVTLAGGCPIGGTLHVRNVTRLFFPDNESYDLEGTVSTWPDCH